MLTAAESPRQIQQALLAARIARGSWWTVAELIGEALAELGRRWERGELSVLEEHLASEQLSRALARVSEELPGARGASRALLLTAEGEEHTLGLALAELVLRELGWRTCWAGRRTPLAEAAAAAEAHQVQLLVVSASEAGHSSEALARQAERLAVACRQAGCDLVLGGSGPWPEPAAFGYRLHGFSQLQQLAAMLLRPHDV